MANKKYMNKLGGGHTADQYLLQMTFKIPELARTLLAY